MRLATGMTLADGYDCGDGIPVGASVRGHKKIGYGGSVGAGDGG